MKFTMKRFIKVLIVFGMVFFISIAYSSIPPHPRVKNRIKDVKHLTHNFQELHSRGWNAPWRETLKKIHGISLEQKLFPALDVNLMRRNNVTMEVPYRALLILVKFSDHDSSVNASFFDGLAFGTSSNTLRNYYYSLGNSNLMGGTLDIVTVNLPSTMGWVQAPQTYSYYVNGQNGFGIYPRNVQKLAEDAVEAVDGIVDFSNYDNDGDGLCGCAHDCP